MKQEKNWKQSSAVYVNFMVCRCQDVTGSVPGKTTWRLLKVKNTVQSTSQTAWLYCGRYSVPGPVHEQWMRDGRQGDQLVFEHHHTV